MNSDKQIFLCDDSTKMFVEKVSINRLDMVIDRKNAMEFNWFNLNWYRLFIYINFKVRVRKSIFISFKTEISKE